jgi:hypothetical protein
MNLTQPLMIGESLGNQISERLNSSEKHEIVAVKSSEYTGIHSESEPESPCSSDTL